MKRGKMHNRGKKHNKEKCCCKSDNILECLATIDCEFDRVRICMPHKHLSRSTREKILTCLVLRDIAILEKKLDKILRELTSDCWTTIHNECDSDSDSDSSNSNSCSDF
jgi:hypothetical protein